MYSSRKITMNNLNHSYHRQPFVDIYHFVTSTLEHPVPTNPNLRIESSWKSRAEMDTNALYFKHGQARVSMRAKVPMFLYLFAPRAGELPPPNGNGI